MFSWSASPSDDILWVGYGVERYITAQLLGALTVSSEQRVNMGIDVSAFESQEPDGASLQST